MQALRPRHVRALPLPRRHAPGDLLGLGSRTRDRADEFADAWGVPERHGSYEELAQSPNVDAVYVATPHPWHHPNTLTCLNAGKHVLVEKPMA
ncbi:Gfo/Idh/MocA family oxidoreductase, partial [Nocardiopsis tropica]|nr:Gfo/Idh/MocA family oxidoreductase [Nocardiopsis tropica]